MPFYNQFLAPGGKNKLLANRLYRRIQPVQDSITNTPRRNSITSTPTNSLMERIRFNGSTVIKDVSHWKQARVNPRISRDRQRRAKYQTKEDTIYEVTEIINDFFVNINEPQLSKKIIDLVTKDDLPDPGIYNEVWQAILDDLITIFSELESVEDTTVENFNSVAVVANRLTARLKSVASKLGDYILFTKNPNNDSFYFKDSFNDLSKVQVGTSLLNEQECHVSQVEGIATLPLDDTEESLVQVTETPVINPNSNGINGNNQELGRSYNGDIAVILDNNADTTFEYESVVSVIASDVKPLVLDLTINLGTEEIINHIQINPNNFGTKTVIKIDSIETSFDGQVYTSIKDDIPVGDFVEEDEDNIFTLAPSSSKYAGQGLYTFTPRKVKYVHVVLRQQEPYIIDTPTGKKQRYAIGIRDINIYKYKYFNKGEIISKEFESVDEIRKVLLQTSQNPSQVSELSSINYFISPDNGSTWHEILPKDFPATSAVENIPEVLDFNSVEPDSISTPSPVRKIRFKAVMARDDEKFTNTTSSLNKRITTISEPHTVPQDAPFDIELVWPPVDETVSVIDPLFGSRGLPGSPYIVNNSVDKINSRKFRIPFYNLPRPIKKVEDDFGVYYIETVPAYEWMHVEVAGDEWTQTTVPLPTTTLDYNNLQEGKVYSFEPAEGILEFGDGYTNSLIPSNDDTVAMWFDAERLYPSENEGDHVAQLEFNTSRNKNDFAVKRIDPEDRTTEVLPRRATRINLEHNNITNYTTVSGVLATLPSTTTQVDFINGRDELINNTDWSIDTDQGIIYLGTPTPVDEDFTIEYDYQVTTYLSTDDWDWATTNIFGDSISIKESGWQSVSITEDVLFNADQQILHLRYLATVKGSYVITLSIDGTEAPKDQSILGTLNPFVKEVDFIDGYTELGLTSPGSSDRYERSYQRIQSLTTDTNSIASFSLRKPISGIGGPVPYTHRATWYKKDQATTEVDFVDGDTELSSAYEFSIDRDEDSPTYGTVYMKLPSVSTAYRKLGTMIYYSPKAVTVPLEGLYSVDYKQGIIYTQRPMDPTANPDNPGNWTLEIEYQMSHYEAEYRIARFLDPTSYEVDITNQTVRLNDNEILKHLEVPHGRLDARLPYYLINYDYVEEGVESAEELVDYFSPVLKDYALRILTKGNIF